MVTNPGDAGGQSSAIQSRTPSTRSRDSWVPHSKHSRRQAGIPLYLRRNPFLPFVGNGGTGELRWCGRNGVGRAKPRWRQQPLSPRGAVRRAWPEISPTACPACTEEADVFCYEVGEDPADAWGQPNREGSRGPSAAEWLTRGPRSQRAGRERDQPSTHVREVGQRGERLHGPR
jgi:hypothetical protein